MVGGDPVRVKPGVAPALAMREIVLGAEPSRRHGCKRFGGRPIS